MLRMSYSGKSNPSAIKIAGEDWNGVKLFRSSSEEVDVNWGRNVANAKLNPNISNVTNKKRMRELFKEHDVPMPRLFKVEDILLYEHGGSTDPEDEAGHISWPIVGRPDQHSKGRGLWKCKTHADIRKALRGTRRKRAATHFMEYIDKEQAPREYRVHIFKGKSIRISEKDFDNEGTYTTAKPQHNIKHVRKAAKAAVKAVGLDFGAVDILAGDTDCWVLEVNAAPGLGGSMPKLYLGVFENWKEEQSE